ncbi:hypothetical protein APS56_14605 [Pseudalgibacter alginicilyticus]|uniref:SusC/RagA family TonB-linked outer membrane protein n=1 Tax=Pseudalgibacter alginicilyticus TaxID=1736674 RepID=A0A0P0DDR5_9FLAO|nr:TonB-dependent receptor [Pseudalgibacter alginicilyticus]ALJ06289.1 hypothetical protein APS56_14605 [Pseudalgibacter alginicilyticus]
MEKNLSAINYSHVKRLKDQILWIMKKSLIGFCILFLSNSGFAYSQKLTLELGEVTLEEALISITEKTDINFFYSNFELDANKLVKADFVDVDVIVATMQLVGDGYSVQQEEENIILISPIKKKQSDTKAKESVQIIISGKITDEGGVPLPGASILEKGTMNGVSTDFDGNYEITVSQDAATLVFSYIGFVTQEVLVAGSSNIDIILVADNTNLDEIVIVGYGTQRKKDVAGAISTVDTEDLVLSSSPSIGDVLRGKAAGLQITQNSAQPGGGLDIQIRGAGSINASNEPLVVVDGFPISNFEDSTSGNRYDSGTQSILNSFNPNDIESISILKDASATSIYGARAANGVILLTTKKGKSGKVQVEYNSSFSYQPYTNSFDVLSLQEWMQLRNDVALENWEFKNGVAPYGSNTLEQAIENPVNGVAFSRFYSDDEILNAGSGTNWVDLVTRDGTTQQHNLSLRGGSESTKYYLSGNLYEQKGVLNNSAFDRASLRLNLDQKINDYINVGLNLTTSRIVNENSQLGDGQYENSGLIYSALKYGPHIEAIDEFGYYPVNPENSQEPNPYSLLTITDEGITDRSLTNFFMEIKPIKGMVARFQAGIDQGTNARNTYLPRTTLWGELENGKASIYNQKKNDQLFDFTLNYSKFIKEDHNFNFLIGYSRQKFRTESASSGNSAFKTDAFLWNNLNAGEGTKVLASSKSEENWVSYFGRLNYVYKDRYILTSSIRRDGSSKFAANNQFAVFSSVALAWDISQEPFMQNLKNVSQLKFRIGYGETGNSDFPENAFAAYEYYPAYLGSDESILVGAFQTRLENPDLKWETTKELNLGLDFGFFDGKLSGSVEVYNKNIEDLLQLKAINSYNPLNTVWANVGSTQSKGVELTLNTVNVDTESFKWRSSFTFSKFKDRWKERAEDWKPSVYENVDDPIRSRYSYISDGIMQIGDVVDAQPDLIPGQIKIKDVNGFLRDDLGNPVTDDNGIFLRTGEADGIIDAADTVLMGSTDPDFIAGFSNTLTYKNFDLNFHFNGMFGREMVDPTDLALGVSAEAVATNGQNVLRSIYDRWTPDNPSTTRPSSYYGYPEYGPGDFFLQDAWFIRLQNVSLAYNIPQKTFGKLIKSATVRFDAQNLFVITPYEGVDPETDAYAAAYPNVKTYTIGIDLKF